MRTLIALALLALPAAPYARESAPPPANAPCTQATTACTEWVSLAGGLAGNQARSLIYTSFPLSRCRTITSIARSS